MDTEMTPEEFRKIKKRRGLQTIDMARLFSVSSRIIRMWQSGERQPGRMARKFLRLIDQHPELQKLLEDSNC